MSSDEKIDPFIGEQIVTKKGNTLTVIASIKSVNKSKGKYSLYCNVCSEDKELFPEGAIVSTKYALHEGKVPCGCSNKYLWSERQHVLLIERKCADKGYEFLGFEGEYNRSKSFLKLYNSITDNHWSVTYNNLVNKGRSDPEEANLIRADKVSKANRKDSHMEKVFRSTGSFPLESTFKRASVKDRRGENCLWEYTCPVCSADEYVKEGLCSGVFISRSTNLVRGNKPCRCTGGKGYTRDQRVFLVNKILLEEGCNFLFMEPSKTFNKNVNFHWECKQGHVNRTPVSRFLSGNRCTACAESNCNGYYNNRSEEEDNLYLAYVYSDGKSTCVKVGRSFTPDKRVTQLVHYSGCGIEMFKLYKGKHEDVYKIEQYILNNLKSKTPPMSWSIELISLDDLPRVEDFLSTVECLKKCNIYLDT